MNADRDLAALLVVGLEGPGPTAREWAWLRRWRPAGVILFARNVTGPRQTAALCRDLHEACPGLEIMADHEGGPVAPLARATGRPPVAWGLGLLEDLELTRRVHEATGARLAALGIDRVLAPVADVLTDSHNPVIGVRAFGGDPVKVGHQVAAAVTGLGAGGVGVCLKHWPGHGGTATDSHHLPSEMASAPDAAQAEPFLAGLAAGADAVMLGHLHRGDGLPATLDPAVQAALGERDPAPPLVLTDDITMGALRAPMEAMGVAVPDGDGLVEPGDLGRDWFHALARAGAHRLLIRGIPWGAFPLDEEAHPSEAEPAGETEEPPAPAEAWLEAWRCLVARLPAEFTAGRPDILWLDRTAGDRWGPADGTGAGMVPDLEPRFGAVLRKAPQPVTRLLVTAHRPLDLPVERVEGWATGLEARGQALAVGHPCLETDLAALIPADWEVTYLPEWPL